jgi:hypothetical protein
MKITRRTLVRKLDGYLNHEISQEDLVDWAGKALIEGEVAKADADVLSATLARLGLMDVREFGLTWPDCEQMDEYGQRFHCEVECKHGGQIARVRCAWITAYRIRKQTPYNLLRGGNMKNESHAVKELDVVALLREVAEEGLVTGQVGTVVECLDSDTVEVEFVTPEGETVAQVVLPVAELLVLHDSSVSAMSSLEFLKREAAQGDVQHYHAFLDSIPDVPPLPGDEWKESPNG